MKQLTNLPSKEFKTMAIKIFTGLEKTITELKADLNNEIESLKKNQSEMKN